MREIFPLILSLCTREHALAVGKSVECEIGSFFQRRRQVTRIWQELLIAYYSAAAMSLFKESKDIGWQFVSVAYPELRRSLRTLVSGDDDLLTMPLDRYVRAFPAIDEKAVFDRRIFEIFLQHIHGSSAKSRLEFPVPKEMDMRLTAIWNVAAKCGKEA